MDHIFIDHGLHLNEKGPQIWQATIKAALMPEEVRYETTKDTDRRTNERATRSNTEQPHSSSGEQVP